MQMRTLEGTGRLFDVWRIPGRFTKNPDIIRFPSGKLMLVFCDCDKHWPEESSRITTLESTDGGASWGNPQVVAEARIDQGEERWLTPRLSRLRSGRLAIVCDHDDYHYYHIDRPSGVWIWFSDDEGATWSEPRHTTIPGIEPDRVVELADGALITTTEVVLKDNWRLAMLASRSRDGGLTWDPPSVLAKDPGHDYNEGAVVVLSNGALACVMREENHNGYPSCVAFSYDLGRTWSGLRPLPFSGDRPYAKELRDGRVLVTYRNQAGNRGTHAWVGDLTDTSYQVAGVHYGDEVRLAEDALHIANRPRGVTRYLLQPPENLRSDILLEARLRVAGPAGVPLATLHVSRVSFRVLVLRDAIWCDFRRRPASSANPGFHSSTSGPRVDAAHPVDMTEYRTVRVQATAGRMWVSVDGEEVIHGVVTREWPLEETWFGREPEAGGEVWFRHVSYHIRNQHEPEYVWHWNARRGRLPDQYQLDHVLEISANPPADPVAYSEGQRGEASSGVPDNGYSSWVELPDGSVYFVDYTNHGDPAPFGHLYGAVLTPDDFPPPAAGHSRP
jgi:hypothetical protein